VGKIVLVLHILLVISILTSIQPVVVSESQPVYVAFIWHYHQPWYYSPDGTYFVLPWVRMHSVGNYYKMAYILSKYPDVKVTFTFSGSLLYQLEDYVSTGRMDSYQILAYKVANNESLTAQDIYDMIRIPGGFFDINWNRFVNVIPRYAELRNAAQSAFQICSAQPLTQQEFITCVANQFTLGNYSSQRVIDLAVLFNLFWIDPQVAREQYPQVYQLMQRAQSSATPMFTRDDLKLVLSVQRDIMSKITGIYRDLVARGQAELIPVPYSHPLAPLIADFGWSSDLAAHVARSLELFKTYFNYTPIGVWPAEQAVNDYVLQVFAASNLTWTVTDQSILAATGVDASSVDNYGVPWYADYNRSRIYVFFRNTDISNLISFQYSVWSTDSAVNDLVNRIKAAASTASGPRIIVIALDGENPWENYVNFGDDFLNKLYSTLEQLQSQGVVKTITPGEFVKLFPNTARELPLKQYQYFDLAGRDISNIPPDSYGDGYSMLPTKTVTGRIPEGSWGGNLAMWIGDRQENVAWMWLAKARSDILSKLGVSSLVDAMSVNKDVVEYLLRAEASDWWWWYGGETGSPQTFDPIFKGFLRQAYLLAGLTPPAYLNVTAYPDGQPVGYLNPNVPKPVSGNVLNNKLADWSSLASNGTGLVMPVEPRVVDYAYVAVDANNLYLAAHFTPSSTGGSAIFYMPSPKVSLSPYSPGYNVYPENSTADLGVYLVYAVRVDQATGQATVLEADGRGGWVKLGSASSNVVQDNGTLVNVVVPWSMLNFTQGDKVYITVASYSRGQLVGSATRLGLVYLVQVPRGGVGGAVVFDMKDPVGDDDGPGGYVYPKANVFAKGVFDLTEFKVVDAGDKLVFIVTLANLGGNPWNGPNGWSLQYVHIYIHTTMSGGRTDTYGLNVNLSADSAWHIALLLVPGWGTDPVPKGERAALYYYNDTVVVQDTGGFRVYADPTSNSIIAEVPKSMLFDLSNINQWRFAVAVTSYDGFSSTKVRAFSVDAEQWVCGTGGKYALAVAKGVAPFVFDILAPTAQDQYTMLNSFDPNTGKLATIVGFGPSYTTYTPPTATTTTTTTTTTTPPVTTTATTTTTTSTTTTTTATPTTTTPPATTTTTTATPTTQPQGVSTELVIIIIIVVVVLAVAVVLGFKVK